MSQKSTLVKIASNTNGDFTHLNNHVSITIPDTYKWINGSEAYIDLNVRVAQRSDPTILCPVLYEYNFWGPFSDGFRLIKNMTLKSNTLGIIEQINDVNVIMTNIMKYQKTYPNRSSLETLSGNYNGQTRYSSFINKIKNGTDLSTPQSSVKVFLKDILGVFNATYLPSSKMGNLTIDIEFEKDEERLKRLFGVVRGVPLTAVGLEQRDYRAGASPRNTVGIDADDGKKFVGQDLVLVSVPNQGGVAGAWQHTATSITSITDDKETITLADIVSSADNINIDGAVIRNINGALKCNDQAVVAANQNWVEATVPSNTAYNLYVGQRIKITRHNLVASPMTYTATTITGLSTVQDAVTGNITLRITTSTADLIPNGESGRDMYISIDDTAQADNGVGGGGAIAPYSQGTMTYNIQDVSVVFPEWNLTAKQLEKINLPSLTYLTYKVDRRNVPAIVPNGVYSGQFDLQPNVTNAIMCYCDQVATISNDTMSSRMNSVKDYRLYLNGFQLENRDVNVEKALYRDSVEKSLVSGGINFKNHNGTFLITGSDKYILGQSIVESDQQQSLEYHFNYSGVNTTAKTLYLFKQQLQEIKL